MSEDCCHHEKESRNGISFDLIFHGSVLVIAVTLAAYFLNLNIPYLDIFAQTQIEFLSRMWWGVLLGIFFVGIMSKIPREYFTAILGRGDTATGVIRAAIAGLFLDLCSHGILMVGAKLYERGASIAQVMTFLIASPWNSLSLTIILIALIGWQWTLIYILCSAVIAIVTGLLCIALVKTNYIQPNPHETDIPQNFDLKADAKKRLKNFSPSFAFFKDVMIASAKESKMIIKWLLFGVILAAAIRSFVPMEIFETWFGPTLIGLFLTLIATTIIEVCSEGSAPIASELVTNAKAPGNGFAFLMAGVATDYTEIMILREFTKSWRITMLLPLLTVPQILVFGYIMNGF